MELVELFELQSQDGPCVDASHTGLTVEFVHLRASAQRWPRFSAVAIEAGFTSVMALPLRLRDTTIGALNLFNVEEFPLNAYDIMLAQGFADLATINVLQQATTSEAQRHNEQLTQALAS